MRRLLTRLHRGFMPPPEKMGLLSRVSYHFWRNQLTESGRMLAIFILIAGPSSAAMTISIPLYYFSILVFTLLIVAGFLGILYRPRVEVERHFPERCAAGATVEALARMTNRGRLPLLDFSLSEGLLPSALKAEEEPLRGECLLPGESTEWRYRLTALERGPVDLKGPVVATAFPFGLFNREVRHTALQRILVYPRFTPLATIDLPVGRRHQPGGLQLASHIGDSEEFLGNREYRPGDRLRDIHYGAWARVGFPVVREFQQEYLCRIAMVVDTHIHTFDAREEDALEACLSLGASVADVLSRQEYVIDIFAAGPDLYHFQAGRSLAHLDNILDILACIEGTSKNPFETLAPALQAEIGQISTAVVLLLDWDPLRETFVRFLREMGVEVKVVVVRNTPPTLDPGGFVSEAGRVQVLTTEQARHGVQRL